MNIFTLPDEDEVLSDKLNLDDLFEKKREISETKLGLYNKVLNRIHHKITLTSRNNFGKDQWCWYLIPEVMIGVSRYNVDECIGYIIQKLKNNDFAIRYTNPNLIFISWQHWVPGYVRQEFKEKNRGTFGGNKKYATTDDEYFSAVYCTNARIDKCIFKLIDDGKKLGMEMMGDLLNMVYKDIWEENWNETSRWYSNSQISGSLPVYGE